MKVLMLNYEYPPLGGGAANANKNILEEIARKNDVEIDLVTSSKCGYEEEQLSDNITIYKLDVSKNEIHHWTQTEIIRYMWKGLKKSRELKKKKDYTLMHSWFGFPCGFMARLLRLPYLVGLRGSDVIGFNQRFSIQYILLKPVIKNTWKNAEKIIPNSQGLKQLAQETLEIEMNVIPNGINTNKFQPRNKDKSISSREDLKLLCVARLTPRKRINDIIDAIPDIQNVSLSVIGEGEQEEELKQQVKQKGLSDRIKFLGYLPHEKLPEKYQEADIFVMPSLNEGMSNTVLEAISSGLPIITTRVGGADELIDGNGYIVEKKNPKQIREAIKEYIENPEKLQKHGKKSREIAETMSWEKVTKEYLEAYEKIE